MRKEVLGYFLNNPAAVDTLEGVARWRLLREQVQAKLEETHEALEALVAEGFLLKSSTTAAGALFRMNRERADLAVQFLKQRERKPVRRRARPCR